MTNGLFKYFPKDPDKLEWFANGQILLTPPKYFNDPWDFLVRSEPYTDAEIETQARTLNIPLHELKQATMEHDFLSGESSDYQAEISKRVGVVCLNEEPLDRIMMAHYAESHRGFVAEFWHGDETESHGVAIRLGPFGPAGKVSYRKQPPLLRRDLENMAIPLWTKHTAWEYEREWRVVQSLDIATRVQTKYGENRFLLKFEPSYLCRVIFGLRISRAVEGRLEEMLNRPEYKHVRKEQVIINAASSELETRELPR